MKHIKRITVAYLICGLIGASSAFADCIDPLLEAHLIDGQWEGAKERIAKLDKSLPMHKWLGQRIACETGAWGVCLSPLGLSQKEKESLLACLMSMPRHKSNTEFRSLLQAQALIYNNKDLEALALINEMPSTTPNESTQVIRGMLSLNLGNLDEAQLAFKQALNQNGQRVEALLGMTLVYIQQDKNGLAEKEIAATIKIQPGLPILKLLKGILAAEQGKRKLALTEFKEAIIGPFKEVAQHNLRTQLATMPNRTILASNKEGSQIKTITFVVADKKTLDKTTFLAQATIKKSTGSEAMVTQSVAQALKEKDARHIIVQLKPKALDIQGETLLTELKTIKKDIDVKVISMGYHAAEKATSGLLQYTSLMRNIDRAKVSSFQMVDYTEHSGLSGNTPFVSGSTPTIAKYANTLTENGIAVFGFTAKKKFGLQHWKGVSSFKDTNVQILAIDGTPEIEVNLMPKLNVKGGKLKFSGALSPSIQNADISPGTIDRNKPQDFQVFNGHKAPQYLTSSVVDLSAEIFSNNSLRQLKKSQVKLGGKEGGARFEKSFEGSESVIDSKILFLKAVNPSSPERTIKVPIN